MGKPLAPGVVSRPERKAGKQALLGRRGLEHRVATCTVCQAQEAAHLAVGARHRACAVPDRSVLRQRASRLADLAIGKSKRKVALFVRKAGH